MVYLNFDVDKKCTEVVFTSSLHYLNTEIIFNNLINYFATEKIEELVVFDFKNVHFIDHSALVRFKDLISLETLSETTINFRHLDESAKELFELYIIKVKLIFYEIGITITKRKSFFINSKTRCNY